MKKTKIFVTIAVILISVCGFFLVRFIYVTGFGYPDTNPEKLIITLEERFVLTMPHHINEARASEYYSGFDGSMSFLLKFQTTSELAELFKETVASQSERTVWEYTKARDDRRKKDFPE